MRTRHSALSVARGRGAGSFKKWLALASLLCLAASLRAQERSYFYVYSLDGPSGFYGKAGDDVEAEFFCVLGSQALNGSQQPIEVEGWAFGVEALGGQITAITVVGTDAEPALTAGFERSELTTGPGNEGAISKVIYSNPPASVLLIGQPARIAKIKVAAVIPEVETTVWLRPRGGLRGSIDTVALFVQESGGERKVPRKLDKYFNVVNDVPQARFSLAGPDTSVIVGQAGEIASHEFLCKATGWYPSTELLKVDGWALGVEADGAVITDISVAGTDFEQEIRNGFVRNEITVGPGNEGAVSIVTLPPSAPGTFRWNRWNSKSLARITLESEVPVGGREVTVRYRDGLRSVTGAVVNQAREGSGKVVTPTLEARRLYLADSEPCGPLLVGFSARNTDSRLPFDSILGGSRTTGHRNTLTPVGEQGSAVFYANYILTSSERWPGSGIAGWSLSIEVTGDASPWAVSFKNSAGYSSYEGGFQRTTLADPARGGGRKGFVSAIVPNFDGYTVFYPESTVSVLEMEVRADRPQAGETILAEVRFADGLFPSGMGQPVQNSVTVSGSTFLPCNLARASLVLEFTPLLRFIRGDASNDLAVDISDAIVILDALFGGAPSIPCLAAADANDSGDVDISDPVYLLGYLFLGGSAPPPPFPDCGEADTADSLACLGPPTCP